MDGKAVFERSYPYLIGIAAAFCTWKFAAAPVASSATSGVDARQIASAALNVFGLLTGLLFSVYLLAIAPGGGFLERIFQTGTFVVFRRYVIEAMLLGSAATGAVVPLMATTVDAKYLVWGPAYLAGTFFFGTAALSAFFRVAHIFLLLMRGSSRRNRGR